MEDLENCPSEEEHKRGEKYDCKAERPKKR